MGASFTPAHRLPTVAVFPRERQGRGDIPDYIGE